MCADNVTMRSALHDARCRKLPTRRQTDNNTATHAPLFVSASVLTRWIRAFRFWMVVEIWCWETNNEHCGMDGRRTSATIATYEGRYAVLYCYCTFGRPAMKIAGGYIRRGRANDGAIIWLPLGTRVRINTAHNGTEPNAHTRTTHRIGHKYKYIRSIWLHAQAIEPHAHANMLTLKWVQWQTNGWIWQLGNNDNVALKKYVWRVGSYFTQESSLIMADLKDLQDFLI